MSFPPLSEFCCDPLNVCRVCAERASGAPPNQAAQTQEVIRAMVVVIARLSASPVSLIPRRNRRASDAGLLLT